MDETAFQRARVTMTPHPCAFEKALLTGACGCSLAARRNIAERESVACGAAEARAQCAALVGLLRQNSVFALKLVHGEAPLPHAKEMKLQCGGLHGVERALTQSAAPVALEQGGRARTQRPAGVADVCGLIEAACEKFGSLQNLPYSALVQSVAAWQLRRRRPES
ncbi:MAG: hypothetical protein D4R74_01905 [Betaproteobacteria bacterium]|nr:MAG: hypothetical protein D4R74_01905 [Betaproteobacteria bacterium]